MAESGNTFPKNGQSGQFNNLPSGQMIDKYRELLAHKESQYLEASQQMRKKHRQAKKLRSCLSKMADSNQSQEAIQQFVHIVHRNSLDGILRSEAADNELPKLS
jgi:hypothetical protein